MRILRRAIAVTAVALTMTALAVAPASASPEDGEGCVGFPSLPDTYVCVISVTPGNVVPTTTTATIPVTVPRFCYVADCLGPTTVNVPVPGVQPGSGVVAQLWYKGQYIPIAVGTVPSIPSIPSIPSVPGGIPTVDDALDLVIDVANLVPGTVWEVSWIPIVLVFGSQQGWYDFYCPPSPYC